VGEEATREAIKRYFIGTSKHWDGSTVFWQIDGCGVIRTGKIMQYDSQTGKRVKAPVNRITWVHSVLKLPDFYVSQCLFGEHLLRDATKTVAIVESEKTAIIGSVYSPDMIWLACGGSEGLNIDKCQCLKGRTVILYPDCGMFAKWNDKAKELQAICKSVSVSDLIEKGATEAERKAGFDLADYFVRCNTTDFSDLSQPKAEPVKGQPEEPPTKPQVTANEPPQSGTGKRFQAYVSDTGILYIPTPPDRQTEYTVYSSVEAYNKRSETPHTIPFQSVDTAVMKQVFISLETLLIA
jgi:hypothetical protein